MNGNYRTGEYVFGSWKLGRMIGQGAYGRVFEALKEDDGEVYTSAVKIMTIPQNPGELDSARSEGMDEKSVKDYFYGFVRNMRQEVRLMSDLKGNTNIVSYEDHAVIPHEGKIGWDILIRMELLMPLTDYMKKNTLTRGDVIRLGIDMCRALEACQHYAVIHRDIKPENIFLSPKGDFKLGDFGVARTLERTTGGLSKKGTYTYMAPEVYRGEKYNSTVDIYSLGIVLYRLLNNNRTPFLPQPPQPISYEAREEALEKRLNGWPLPSPCNAEGRLGEIVLKACSFLPKDRYSSPLLMRQELEAIQLKPGEEAQFYGKKTVIPLDSTGSSGEDLRRLPDTPEAGPAQPQDKTAPVDDETTVLEEQEPSFRSTSARGTVSGRHITVSSQEKTAGTGKGKKKKRWILPALLTLLAAVLAGVFLLKKPALPTGKESSAPETAAETALVTTPVPLSPEPGPVSAEEADHWEWSLENGVLTISGKGPMDDYSEKDPSPWFAQSGSITRAVVEEGITSVGSYAFYGCDLMEEIRLPQSLTSIGKYAFWSCKSLTSLTLPEGLHSLSFGTFSRCSSLSAIEIPASVGSIEEGAFMDSSLREITLAGENPVYTVEDSVLYTKDRKILLYSADREERTAFTIPSGVEKIASYAFYRSSHLTSVEIPETVTSVGICAFSSCGLQTLMIPDSVTYAGQEAFGYCDSLTAVTVPGSLGTLREAAFYSCGALNTVVLLDGITQIGPGVFDQCGSLTSVSIPASVTAIGKEAFARCWKLEKVTYTGTEEEWKQISVGEKNEPLTSALLECGPAASPAEAEPDHWEWSLENGVLTISGKGPTADYQGTERPPWYGQRESIRKVVISEGITRLGDHILYDLDNMDILTLPASLTSIGEWAVKSFAMISLDIPARVTKIGENAFAMCAVLQKITVAEGNPAYTSVDGVLYTKDGRTLVAYPGDREGSAYSVPEGVTRIAGGAFFINLELRSIELPASLTSLGTFTFNYCFALQRFTVAAGNSVLTASGGVLYTKDMSTLLKFPPYCGKTDFIVPDGVTAIGDFAFSDCEDISSVKLADSVVSVGQGAFTNCINLRAVTLPAGLQSIGQSAFSACDALAKVTFAGTRQQWSSVRIAEENEPLRSAPIDYGA